MKSFRAAVVLCCVSGLATALGASTPPCRVYIGTQGSGAKGGIYLSLLDTETGSLTKPLKVASHDVCEWQVITPDHTLLYSLAHVPGAWANHVEAIDTYRIDPKLGGLTQVGERLTGARDACHLSLDPTGQVMMTAAYTDAMVNSFRMNPDGTVGVPVSSFHLKGSGPDSDRQRAAHPHSINVDPTGKWAIVPDLGQDKLFIYRIDPATGTLTPNAAPNAYGTVAPGSGPRHFVYHPDGKHAFVINEMGATVTAFDWDPAAGSLKAYQNLKILRSDYHGGTNTAAEIAIGKSGQFLYGSLRGDDSLMVLAMDPSSGKLSVVQRMHEGVVFPRAFAIDPSGKWLLCANQNGDTVTVYSVDASTGFLAFKGGLPVAGPMCISFLQE